MGRNTVSDRVPWLDWGARRGARDTRHSRRSGNAWTVGYVVRTTMEEKRPEVTTALAQDAALTAADRCDRCGAQAYLRVELQSGGELLFCNHHAKEHGARLEQLAAVIHRSRDES